MELLTAEEIEQRAQSLAGWRVEGANLVREFKHGDFAGSVDFVNRVLPLAEQANHHPDLAISWDTVTVTLSTHSAGGLTKADFELAEQIGTLA